MKIPTIVKEFALILRAIPHRILFGLTRQRFLILSDLERWITVYEQEKHPNPWDNIFWALQIFPEFRTLFYYRLSKDKRFENTLLFLLAKLLNPPMDSLYILTPEIGPGLFIQHGFATIIHAKRIGGGCWINQQVTIGYSDKIHSPIIGDNVIIYAGAKIIGDVSVGDNAIVGANAVVIRDIPANCTVVGVPAYLVKKNGMRIRKKL